MSLNKNQLELLKIAKSLVGFVLDEGELAQDEEENLNHVYRLLYWHTTDTRIEKVIYPDVPPKYEPTFNFKRYEPLVKPTEPMSEESPDYVVYDSLYKNDPKCSCWFCADRK